MRKAQQQFVSHTIVIGFASILVAIVAASLITMHGDFSKTITDYSSNRVCGSIRLAVADIFSNNLTNGRIELRLDDKLGDKNYKLSAHGSVISIQTDDDEKSCQLGYPVNVTGRVSGGMTALDYERVNGTVMISFNEMV